MILPAAPKKSLVNLTPLIDVVFILLIFFMLASNFIRWNYIELSVGDVAEIEINHDEISIITIRDNSTFLLNDVDLPIDQIVNKVRQRVRRHLDHPIAIHPDKNTDVQAVVDVLSQLSDFAGSNISIATKESAHK